MVDYQMRRAGMQFNLRNNWNKGCKCNQVSLHVFSLLLSVFASSYSLKIMGNMTVPVLVFMPTKKD